ncbi:hypothetical protein VIGAN_03182600, partial [Vigna angularis var. angularis]
KTINLALNALCLLPVIARHAPLFLFHFVVVILFMLPHVGHSHLSWPSLYAHIMSNRDIRYWYLSVLVGLY